MKNLLTERTLTSDWVDPECGGAPTTLHAGATLGPFLVRELLGHGGMGVVYAATHRETGAEVALKTLQRVDARAATRLKSEFRHLARIRHPHLVQLFELHTIESHCFLTMERIDGVSLSTRLTEDKKQGTFFYEQLRNLFGQLTEGLLALHDEGLLHLDLKPDNVMVDRDDSVRILDFGLVAPLHERSRKSRRGIGGTPRYMAPERLRGAQESTSADWYSFGVMLAEQIGAEGISDDVPPQFPPHAPRDLVDLCVALLHPNPEKRLAGSEVALQLGAKPSGTYRASRVVSGLSSVVVGRDAEVAQLKRALKSAQCGTSNWVHLAGESGIGKTVLMNRFRDSLRSEPGVAVFEGVCHERESTPFQGLDGILDDLAAKFAASDVPLGQAERVLCEHALSLSDAFADLCTWPSISTSPASPTERRRAAFSAIKSLLTAVTRRQTAVLLIDDVHWGDSDGARLLAEILATPTPRHLLLVTTSQAARDCRAPFLEELDAVLGVRGATLRRAAINLGRLPPHHTLECVRPHGEPKSTKQCDAIVRASGGLPFLAAALGSHPWAENETPSLRSLIEMRLRDAPPGAIEMLRAISLSPSPLPQAVALEQVADARLRGAVLAALRNSDLVRTSGTTPDAPLEPYHALVAKTVQSQLDPAHRGRIRSSLASALEEKGLATSEQLAHLFHLAGNNPKAARWAPIAASDAECALAFESAAHWYARAASWIPEKAEEYLPNQARCLEHAGRSAEAAAAYEECAQLIQGRRGEYVRAAGSSWLNAGHVDRGLSVLVPELEKLGIPIPRSEGAALARSMYLLWKLWRRGTDFSPLPEPDCDRADLSRVDAVWHAAKGLGAPLPLRGLALQLQCLILALKAREPVRIARSLAVLGPTFIGSPWENLGKSWTARAHEVAQSAPTEYLRGILLTFDAVRMTSTWETPEFVLARADQAFNILKEERGAIVWEQSMAFTVGLRAREQLGRFDELERLGALWLAESTDRGDLFAQAMACHACVISNLARGQVEDARALARRSVEKWSKNAYTVQHYYALRFDIQCDLMAGNYGDAHNKLTAAWTSLAKAQLPRHPISRPEILLQRGLVEVALSVSKGRPTPSVVAKIAKSLTNDENPVCRSHGHLLRAAWHFRLGRTDASLRDAEQATSEYQGLGQLLHAVCSDLFVARVTEDPARIREAKEQIRALGVENPEMYARIHAPLFVFGPVETPAAPKQLRFPKQRI